MSLTGPPRHWDLVRVDLDPREGSEQGGERPALVVSNDGFNQRFPLVTVLPLTRSAGKRRRVYPFEVLLPAGAAGNAEESIVMPQQIRTVARSRITERMGNLASPELRRAVEARIVDHLGIGFDEDPAG